MPHGKERSCPLEKRYHVYNSRVKRQVAAGPVADRKQSHPYMMGLKIENNRTVDVITNHITKSQVNL